MQVKPSVDRAIADLAALQHGVVTREQLTAAGLGRGAIGHRLAQGRLHPLHRGVFLVGHQVPPPRAREAAAVFACGKGAVLSHSSAGDQWGFSGSDAVIHVTVAARNPKSRAGVHVHRVRHLCSGDVRRHHGLPLTSPARTLLDLAEVLPSRPLERALDEALRMRLTRPRELRAILERSPGRHGAAVLRALLDRTHGPTLTRSEAEERLLALVRAARLPHPELNVRVAGSEVDFLWRDAGLVVEVDGFAYHSTRAAFERDRRRDAKLQSVGFAVVRVTWRQILDEPEALVALLAQSLARPD
jgi:very-short-patch-repair endonuclease